ncbi:MAG: helix-turn-helix domain-containing protein [Vallitaleaceae bacterium]|nr:helix-turn-helix domain-containing protein [Vallitaleaceae bacterium]
MKELCVMIDHTYRIIVSYHDVLGNRIYQSTSLDEEQVRAGYDEQVNLMVDKLKQDRCKQGNKQRDRRIQITIDEIALTWIGIPVITDFSEGFLIIGPFYSSLFTEDVLVELVASMPIKEEQKLSILRYHRYITFYPYKEYVRMIRFIYFFLYHVEMDDSMLSLDNQVEEEKLNQEERKRLTREIELEFHGSYLFEQSMMECIRTGNLVNLKEVLQAGFKGKTGEMIIGNELRQYKNTFIVSTTLATRAAIEGGLNSEIAMSLSDLYIRQCENMRSVQEINLISEKMVYDFTQRVHQLIRVYSYSYYVNLCCDFIQSNVYTTLKVSDIANSLGISQEHLSRVFHQETGITVSDYIKKMKVREAKFLLKYTENSLVEISEKLAFSSQSYFTTIFRGEMGLTPKSYRSKVKIHDGVIAST